MNLIVRALPASVVGEARLGAAVFPCALGAAGIREPKREGDMGTPAGRFAFRRVLYRADRVPAPMTKLPVTPIGEADGWCDDSTDAAYNTPVRLPHTASHERLWRDDHLYDIVVVIGHNDAPVVPGAGSAVFLHLARPDFGPTQGCVAFHEADLRSILAAIGPDDVIDIGLR